MLAEVYDPQGKAVDVYGYTDAGLAERADLTLSNLSNKQKALRNIGGRPNRNLLDNWYFVGGGSQQGGGQFPINQRGQTSYAGGTYGIDRWQFNCTITIENDGCYFASSHNGKETSWTKLPLLLYLAGKTVTFSILTVKNTLGYITYTIPTGSDAFVSQEVNVGSEQLGIDIFASQPEVSLGILECRIRPASTTPVGVVAAKLELGPTQTLAYQDEEGNWQLFETPDYGEELAKCQRYLLMGKFEGFRSNKDYSVVFTPSQMRVKPSIIGTPEVRKIDDNTIIDNVSVSVYLLYNHQVILKNTQNTEPFYIHFPNGSGLSAEL